ncbi:MAG: transcription elongation factor Spt5 [Candidatus Aenigmatarchaeota archaeon]
MAIYTVRTTAGRENIVINAILNRIKTSGLDIKAMFHPSEIKGYIFIEGTYEVIEKAITGVPHIRGLIKKEIPISEIKKFMEIKKTEIKLNRGDIIEVISGPFKGEKGKVTRFDEAKREVTIELLEAVVPIPITVSTDVVKIIEHAEKKAGE